MKPTRAEYIRHVHAKYGRDPSSATYGRGLELVVQSTRAPEIVNEASGLGVAVTEITPDESSGRTRIRIFGFRRAARSRPPRSPARRDERRHAREDVASWAHECAVKLVEKKAVMQLASGEQVYTFSVDELATIIAAARIR